MASTEQCEQICHDGNSMGAAKRRLCPIIRTATIVAAVATAFSGPIDRIAQADIFEWAWVDPADPSQGKFESDVPTPDGLGRDARNGANLSGLDLTRAYLIETDLIAILDRTTLTSADLSSARLYHARMAGADLTDANLQGANLKLAGLWGADLTGADLRGAKLKDTKLWGATLRAANLSGVNLAEARYLDHVTSWADANLSSTDLSGVLFGKYAPKHVRHDFGGVDLSGADLSGARFLGGKWWGPRLKNADLGGANLTGVYLQWAGLKGADLTEAIAIGANLEGANLAGARLTDADLTNSRLFRANLSSAILTGANLTDANLNTAKLSSATLFETTLTGVKLWRADLSSATLTGTDFREARNLTRTSFQAANLTNANLSGTDLTDANLGAATLTNAKLIGANLTRADLRSATLTNANVDGADLTWASLVSADLTNVDLTSADITNSNLQTTVLSNADLSGADLTFARLTGAEMESATLTDTLLTGADLRGAHYELADLAMAADITNVIHADGHMDELVVGLREAMHIWDADIGADIVVQGGMSMAANGTLRFVFQDGGRPTVAFEPGIPVVLDGTLELLPLRIRRNGRTCLHCGTTVQLFDWTGVTPTGSFRKISTFGTQWSTGSLYTTGWVTLIPEPGSCALLALGSLGVLARRRRKAERAKSEAAAVTA